MSSDVSHFFFNPEDQALHMNRIQNAPLVQTKEDLRIAQLASKAITALDNASLKPQADGVKSIIAESKSQKFTVAVVGEFSRGKSTFVNNLLGRDILPVSNMPTTAMLTRIRHSPKEEIVIIDAKNKAKKSLPLSKSSWANYVADDNGNDPNGVAFVNVNSPWLKNGIEIIDTPGAGDLELSRARLIGDALKSSDAAIITISALSALSMSEKLFIEERLIMKKTPFLMLIVTKLDHVDVKQRNGIIDYIKEKLKMWKFDGIEVFIPYNLEMPDAKYHNIMGMDKIVNHINSLMVSSERKQLTTQWTANKLKSHLLSAIDHAKECQCIMDEKDAGRKEQLLERKAQLLENADKIWDETRLQMLKKADDCYNTFVDKVNELKASLAEKMQFEASHIANPQRWWEEDFPYKLKIEMTNLANATEALITRTYSKDAAWFNSVLEKNFKAGIVINADDDIIDRNDYSNIGAEAGIQFEDLSKARNVSKIGLTALTLCAALSLTALHLSPLFATMGIGTGGSMLSETFFKKKTDAQKQALKDEIEKRIPIVVQNATSHSESRIKSMYLNVIKEASKHQESWVDSQKSVIASASDAKTSGVNFNSIALIKELNSICDTIDAEFSC